MKKDLELLLASILLQHKKKINNPISKKTQQELELLLGTSYFENRLYYKKNSSGKILYYFIGIDQFRAEFNETMVAFPYVYYARGYAPTCFKAMKKALLEIKLSNPSIVNALVCVDSSFGEFNNIIKKKSKLTAVELLGNVKKSIGLIKKKKMDKTLIGRAMRKKDIDFCVKRDINAHQNDPTSRMNERFSMPDAFKFSRPFYKNLVKKKQVIVAEKKIKNKKRILGAIGFFVNEDERMGLVASIYVDHLYQNQGVGTFLYLSVLKKFDQLKLVQFIGSSTTSSVLMMANSIGRKEVGRVWILKS